ncbi:unnamed protein product, partial [marine sediment metagenome]
MPSPLVNLIRLAIGPFVSLLTMFLILAASCASRTQSLRETSKTSLKYAILLCVSRSVWLVAVYTLVIAAMFRNSPLYWVLVVCGNVMMCYVTVAAVLSAARLTESVHVDLTDPLWPQCLECGYSLRGLPTVEDFCREGLRQSHEQAPASQESGQCPEC